MPRLSKRCRLLVSVLLVCGFCLSFSSVSFAADAFRGSRISSSSSANGVNYRVVASSSDPWVEFETVSSISASTAYTMYRGYIKDYYTVTLENTNDFPTYLSSGEEMYLQAYCANPGYGSYFGTDNGFTISIDDFQGCHISSVGIGSGGNPSSQVYFYLDESHYHNGNLVLLPHETVTVSFTAIREYSVYASDNSSSLHSEKTLIQNGLQSAYINSATLFNVPTSTYTISNFPISSNGGASSSMSPSNLGQRTVNIVSSIDGTQFGNFQYSYTPFVASVRDSYLVPNFDSNGDINRYYYESIIDYTTILDLNIVNWTNNDILINRQSTATGSGLLRFGNFSFASPSSSFSVQSFTVSDVTPTNQYFTAAIESNGIAISPPVDYVYRDRIFLPNRTSVLGNIKVTFTVKVRYNESIHDSSITPDSSVLSPMLNLDFGGFDFIYSPLEAEIVSDLVVNDSDRLDSIGEDINNQIQQQQQQHEEQMQQSQEQYEDFTDPDTQGGSDLITGTEDEIEGKIGIFTFIDNLIQRFLGLFTISDASTALTLPAFTMEIQGETYQIWNEYTFDLSSLDGPFNVLITAVRFATVATVYFAFLSYLQKTYNRIIGGHDG